MRSSNFVWLIAATLACPLLGQTNPKSDDDRPGSKPATPGNQPDQDDAKKRDPRNVEARNDKENEQANDRDDQDRDDFAQPKEFRRASELSRSAIVDKNNSRVGKFEDAVIDPESGRVMYGIMSRGEGANKSDYYAVPWSSFSSGA